MNVKLNQN